MFTTTISEVKSFWNCPTRWHIQYVYPRRSPRAKGTALVAGIVWHEFMENLLNGSMREPALKEMQASMQDAIDEAETEGWDRRAKELGEERQKMLAAGELWKDWLPCQTLAVEKPLELLIPAGELGAKQDIRILGRQDRVIRLTESNKIAHFQHRTRAASKPVGPYLDSFQRNPYEGCYWEMLKREYGEEPFGVVISLFRKLSEKTIRATPEVALQQHPIPISAEQSMRTVKNVVRTCNTMMLIKGDPDQFLYDNPDMDLGRYDNSVDPYFDYLSTGDFDLLMDDTQFMNTEERYGDIEVKESV